MTEKAVKRGWLDWAVIGMVLLIPTSLAVIAIANPNPETKTECIRRITKEISDRYYHSGKYTIDTPEEIEAIASEVKSKCP